MVRIGMSEVHGQTLSSKTTKRKGLVKYEFMILYNVRMNVSVDIRQVIEHLISCHTLCINTEKVLFSRQSLRILHILEKGHVHNCKEHVL